MKFLSVALAMFIAQAHATSWTDLESNPSYSYNDWVREFGVSAPSHSAATFNENLAHIKAHNAKNSSYKMGVNKFTGMTKSAFAAYIGHGYAASPRATNIRVSSMASSAAIDALMNHKSLDELPAELDWREKGVVTEVKDQGQCGGCWAFSTAETVESHVAIQTGTLVTLSEQQLIDCTPNEQHCGGTGGCNGATQELGFAYVAANGLTTETGYPYEAYTGTCPSTNPKAAVGIKDFVALPPNNYTALINAAALGPVAISAAASPWQFYESGVFDSNSSTDVNHAIQLVGWGTENSIDYYIVRNSWGTSWGEGGYIRIKRFGEGAEPCGTDNTPLDGDGCEGGPSSIQVCGVTGLLSDSSYPTGGFISKQ